MEEITDFEIRFIKGSSACKTGDELQSMKDPPPDPNDNKKNGKKNKWRYALFGIIIIILIIIAGLILLTMSYSPPKDSDNRKGSIDSSVSDSYEDPTLQDADEPEGQFEMMDVTSKASSPDQTLKSLDITARKSVFCCEAFDTINDIPIRTLLADNAVPEFHVGKIDTSDESIVLALQAADIRKDNGKIVGAAINKGEVVSKGLSKKGFVAIINGKMTIGVSESSPLFEQAIETGGDFFRQYPLVSNGTIVENKPKGRSVRRAICEMSGSRSAFVVESKVPVSFHDFSQVLVDMGVRNAVYLVGSEASCGFKRGANGAIEHWGVERFANEPYISYLIWRKR